MGRRQPRESWYHFWPAAGGSSAKLVVCSCAWVVLVPVLVLSCCVYVNKNLPVYRRSDAVHRDLCTLALMHSMFEAYLGCSAWLSAHADVPVERLGGAIRPPGRAAHIPAAVAARMGPVSARVGDISCDGNSKSASGNGCQCNRRLTNAAAKRVLVHLRDERGRGGVRERENISVPGIMLSQAPHKRLNCAFFWYSRGPTFLKALQHTACR